MGGEWVEARLGNICTFSGGTAFPKKYQGSADGPIPFIKVSDMNLPANARKIVEANNWIDEGVAAHTRARRHPAGAVIFAKIGVALTYNRRRILTRPTVIDNNMMAAIPNIDAVDPLFLYYLLTTVDFNEVVAGTALPYLNAGDLTEMEVKIPRDKAEQRAIAHILGTLDDKIELLRKMNETLEAMARAIFKSWFVDFDPVRAKAEGRDPGLPKEIADLFPDRFVDSELGEIPEGWSVRPLDEIADFRNGLPLQNYPPNGGESLPVIKIAQLRAGTTDGANRASVNVPGDYVISDGDVLFSWSGSLILRIWCGGEGALNQHLFKVTSTEHPKWFYYFWIGCHLPDFRAIAAGKATTMGHIQRHHLAEALTVVPDNAVLKAANGSIAPLLDSIVANAIQSRTLADLRDALLPKLISGELRVKHAQAFLKECAL